MIDLNGKRALVTGGGRGIGRATALLLARAGAAVAIGYRSRREEAEETCQAVARSGGRAVGVAGDLGDPGAAQRVVDAAAQALGGLDLLIVNHGVWPADDVPLAKMTDAQWDGTRRANLDGVLYVCRAAIPLLPDHQGRDHFARQVARRGAGAAHQRQLRRARVGRYRNVRAALCPGRGRGEAGDRADHPAGACGERRGRRGTDRVSVLGCGTPHHGRDPECEWGERAVWMTRLRNAKCGMRNFGERSFAARRSHSHSAFHIPHSALDSV